MAKLDAEAWERALADVAAAATRQVNAEGVAGADDLEPVVTLAEYDGAGAAVPSGVRRFFYSVLRALRSSGEAPAWIPLRPAGGWSTGLDGEPAAAWRRLPDGQIALRGRLTGSTVGFLAGPLPLDARPARERRFVVLALAGSLTARVSVRADGWIILDAYGTGAGTWLELDAVRFDLG